MASSKAVPLRLLFPTLLVACFANRKSFQARTKTGQCSKNIFSQQIKNQMLWFWRDGYFKVEISHTGIGLITIKLSPLYSLPLGPWHSDLWNRNFTLQEIIAVSPPGVKHWNCWIHCVVSIPWTHCSWWRAHFQPGKSVSICPWRTFISKSLHFWKFRDGYLHWWVSYTWNMMRLLPRGLALAEGDDSKNI